MKFYLVLAATVTLIVGSYFYKLHQDDQRVQQQQLAKAAELERMKAASLSAEQAEAALAAQAGAEAQSHSKAATVAAAAGEFAGSAPSDPKRIKIAFGGQAPEMKRKAKKFDHFEEMYVANPDDEDGFKFSSAQYSHQKAKPERTGTPGNLSDDLLIVESRLEDRARR